MCLALQLQVPTTLNATSFKITMDGASKEDDGHPVADGLSFEDEKSIRLERKGVSVFIQTDKAIYKPSQTGACLELGCHCMTMFHLNTSIFSFTFSL